MIPLTETLDHFQTVDSRHMHVDQSNVDPIGFQDVECLLTVSRFSYTKTVPTQPFANNLPKGGIIVRHEKVGYQLHELRPATLDLSPRQCSGDYHNSCNLDAISESSTTFESV